MKIKETMKIPKKDIIIPDERMRPLEDEKDDEIQNLSTSIKNNGLINDVDVRIVDGHYKLMAGGRRFVATKDNRKESCIC